jgi:hypothetical protein
MDNAKIELEGRYNQEKLNAALEEFLVSKLGLRKGEDGFYYGRGTRSDYAHFGAAMTTLGKKSWFMDNVDTWLYFNSDDRDDPEDFEVEDFKEFCQQRYQATA